METETPKRFGDLLKALRERWTPPHPRFYGEHNGKPTQETLGVLAGVGANYISMFERGVRVPSSYRVTRLADALGLSGTLRERFEAAARIERGLQEDRRPEEQVAAPSRAKFINPPPFVAPGYFQDRHVETGLVARFIGDEAIRLVTVVGRSGVGKTALVCRLLRALESGNLPDDGGPLGVDGIVYLSNAGRHQLTFANLYADLCKLLPQHLAERIEAVYRDPEVSTRFKVGELLAAFPEGRFVVLLDNFEDLMDDELREVRDAEMDEALPALLNLPHHPVTVVLTTQWAPRSLGMVQHGRQRSLPLDEGLGSPFAEDLLREMDTTGKLGLKTAPDALLREVRERTNGYPRALEALFAILEADRDTSLREILEDTRSVLPDDVIRVLVGEAFGRLDPDAQLVMQALAIYNRPVTPTAIDYLLQPWLPTVDGAPTLKRLVNLRLVRKEAGRYYLHTTDREYALGRAPEGEEQDRAAWRDPTRVDPPPFVRFALRDRAASYFQAVRKPREEWTSIDDLEPQLAEFDLRCEAGDHDAAARVLREIDRDHLFVWGHYERAAEMYERFRGKLTDLDLEQHCTGYLGRCYANQVRYHEAIELVAQALAITRATGDRRGEGRWLNNLSIYYGRLGQMRKAIEYIEGEGGALQIAREVGDERGEGARLNNLSTYYARLGDVRKAKELIAGPGGSLDMAIDAGDRRGQGVRMETLAQLEIDEGNLDHAIQLCRDAIAIGEEFGSPVSLSFRNTCLAQAFLYEGNLAGARVAAARACGYDAPRQNHNALALLGVITSRQEDRTTAREAFEAAVAKADTILERNAGAYEVLDGRALALCGLVLLGDTVRLEEATASYRLARAITTDAGIVGRVLRLFDALAAVDSDGLLAEVRPVAGGREA